MPDDLLDLAADLRRRGVPFALATVVRCEPPTSAKPGAKAIVREDGGVTGWVGGACAEPVVVREARAALRDGRPRLVGLVGDGAMTSPGGAARLGAPGAEPAPRASRTEGLLEYPMTCHSGGTLEIYVEPYLPKPSLVLVGHGPVIDTLAALAGAADYAVTVLATDRAREALESLAPNWRASVVVATHADADEAALDAVLRTEAGYVSLVASRRRAAVVLESLARHGLPAERRGRLKAPAGLDIGAVTPEEIAVSILAEIVQHRRSAKSAPPEVEAAAGKGAATGQDQARDPICGMMVEIATARHRSQTPDGTVSYFCCRSCQEAFEGRSRP